MSPEYSTQDIISQNNLEKESAKEIFNYLDPLVEETFNLKARKEYSEANMEDFAEKMWELSERAENLGVVDEIADEKFNELEKNYEESANMIKENAVPDKELEINSVVSFIRSHGGNEIENKINEYFSTEVKSWEEFIAELNQKLKSNEFYWDTISEIYK